MIFFVFFFFQAEDGIRDLVRSRGLGDVYKRQIHVLSEEHYNQYHLNSDDYITAFCHKREEQRTFRFDRINELEILNI